MISSDEIADDAENEDTQFDMKDASTGGISGSKLNLQHSRMLDFPTSPG